MNADEDDIDLVAADAVSVADDDAVEIMWLERNARPFTPTPTRPMRAVRCTGVTRNGPRAGKRCGRESTLGTVVCESHGAKLPAVKAAAANRRQAMMLRLIDSSDGAVETLVEMMRDASSEAVKLKAATEILDRAGVRGGVDVNLTVDVVTNPADILRDRLESLRKRNEAALESEHRIIEGVTVDTPVPDEADAAPDSDASER